MADNNNKNKPPQKSTKTMLRDAGVKAAVDTERFGISLSKDVQEILNRAQEEIIGEVSRIDPSGVTALTWRQQRLLKVQDSINALLGQTYGDILKKTGTDLSKFGSYIARRTVGDLNQSIGVEIADVKLAPDQLKAIASSSMVKGRLLKTWWKDAQDDTKRRLSKAMSEATLTVQAGMVKGEALGKIVTGVKQALNTSRSEAEALVRTSVSQVCNDARVAMYKQNADIIKGMEACATLDTRTTPLCRSLDRKRWTLDGKPIGHNMRYPGFPAHFRCRTTTIPITKTFAELAGPESPLTKPKIRKLEQLTPTQRAAMDGPVAASTDYAEWLRSQPESVQRDALGPKRFEMFQAGKLKSMADLVHQTGRGLTIAELEERFAQNGALPMAAVLQECEKEICKRTTEKMYALDPSTGRVIMSKEGARNYLSLTEREGLMMQDAVVTHNHPMGTTFTHDDIESLVMYHVRELRIATPRKAFSLSIDYAKCPHVKPEEILREIEAEAFKHEIDLIDSTLDALLTGEMTPAQFEKGLYDEVWKRTSRKLKWLKYQAKNV